MLEGRDGWLFLRLELKRACTPPMPFRQALERWALLLSIVRTYGRRAILVVPPDKGSIYGEYLPGGELAECARRSKPRLWHLLARERRGSGVIGLERALVRERRRRGDLVYSKRDSHWTGVGALEMVRSVLDRLGGRVRLKAGEVVRLGEDRYIGDLTVLRGEPTMDTRPAVSIRRAAGARRVPGRTLFVGDSFGEGALPYLKPYFSDLRELAWEDSTRAQLELEIERADTVIFESVEREFAFRTSDRGSLSKDFLERLRRRLGSDP